MNENAKKWVAALRSGEYNQTQNWLQDENGFCCLGVACDLYRKETKAELTTKDGGYIDGEDLDDQAGVQQWLGLKSSIGCYESGEGYYDLSLIHNNDENRWTFNQIADLIESEPEGLFI